MLEQLRAISPVTAAVCAWLRTPAGAEPWSPVLLPQLQAHLAAHPEQLGPCVDILVSGASARRCAQMRVALGLLVWSSLLEDTASVAKGLVLTVEVLVLTPRASWTVQFREEQGLIWDDVSAAVTTWLRALAAVVEGASQPQGGSPLRALFGRAP